MMRKCKSKRHLKALYNLMMFWYLIYLVRLNLIKKNTQVLSVPVDAQKLWYIYNLNKSIFCYLIWDFSRLFQVNIYIVDGLFDYGTYIIIKALLIFETRRLRSFLMKVNEIAHSIHNNFNKLNFVIIIFLYESPSSSIARGSFPWQRVNNNVIARDRRNLSII